MHHKIIMRLRIDICYNGTSYQGWQVQPHTEMTIQQQIQKALKTIFQKDISLHGSGRTDTGVHAENQVAHFDIIDTSLTNKIASKMLHVVKALNSQLPSDILVKKAYIVPDHFHARKSAIKKIYVHRIFNGPYLDPFLNNHAHWISRLLDLDYLNNLTQLLLGQKDFKSFQNSGSNVEDTYCTIFSANWSFGNWSTYMKYDKKYLVEFQIEGNRFLKQMVRNILGTLLWMELKKMDITHLSQIIKTKDRKKAYNTAPAVGLYLKDVVYPDNLQEQCVELKY